MSFETAVEIILKHEGGFVNDPDDPGGATKYGISNRSHGVDRDGDGDVDSSDAELMTIEEARTIYRENYWEPMRCDELHPAVALCVFDSAVNQGKGRASKLLQTAVGATADGIIGPRTMAKINGRSPWRVVRDFQARRVEHYDDISDHNKKLQKYEYGWCRRVIETAMEATKLL